MRQIRPWGKSSPQPPSRPPQSPLPWQWANLRSRTAQQHSNSLRRSRDVRLLKTLARHRQARQTLDSIDLVHLLPVRHGYRRTGSTRCKWRRCGFRWGLRMDPGQRLSGWVAVNRRTIPNSDAALDLPDIARETDPPLKNCLSTPLLVFEELVGVLALYTSNRDGFTDEQRNTLEAIAVQIALGLKRARASDHGVARHAATTVAQRGPVLLPAARSR